MTDLEMTRLCAEAMGLTTEVGELAGRDMLAYVDDSVVEIYDPLHDDAQAMALVKKFPDYCIPHLSSLLESTQFEFNLNRAIVECVAKMQAAKASA